MNTPSFLTEPTPALPLDLPPSAPRRRSRSGDDEPRRRDERPAAPPAPAGPETARAHALTDDGSRSTWRAVYTIVERGGRRLWLRIGTAFINRDQSLNVRLDAVPVNGQLHIREAPPPGSFAEREPARDGQRPDPSAPAGG